MPWSSDGTERSGGGGAPGPARLAGASPGGEGPPGGAVYSEPYTLPGYVHDVGAAFFPFGSVSPAFRSLDLPGAGLKWRNARRESCHLAPDGSSVSISRDLDSTAASFGVDGPAWHAWGVGPPDGEAAPEALLAPLPALAAACALARLT